MLTIQELNLGVCFCKRGTKLGRLTLILSDFFTKFNSVDTHLTLVRIKAFASFLQLLLEVRKLVMDTIDLP